MTKQTTPFAVGDRVTKFFLSVGKKQIGFATVIRVAKTKLVLDDGTAWMVNGQGTWPNNRWSNPEANYLLPFDPAHERQKAEQDATKAAAERRQSLLSEASHLIARLPDAELEKLIADLSASPSDRAA